MHTSILWSLADLDPNKPSKVCCLFVDINQNRPESDTDTLNYCTYIAAYAVDHKNGLNIYYGIMDDF